MKKKAYLLTALALMLCTISFAQKTQQQWWSGEQTVWHKNHNIVLPTSGISSGDFTFDFGGTHPDYGVWGVYSPGYGIFLSARPNGRVGIGTDNPSDGFHVKTNMTFQGNINFKGEMFWQDGYRCYLQGAYHDFRINSTKKTDALYISNKDYRKMITVRGNGFVGINTENPETDFDVASVARFRANTDFDGTTKFNKVATFNENAVFNNIGIGTNDPQAPLHLVGDAKVEGNIIAKRVSLDVGSFPDYVFEKDYKLMTLQDLEAFVKQNKHLPGIPSEKDIVSRGMDVAQINTLLVEKVEELTLYTIDQEKKLNKQDEEIQALKDELKAIKESLNIK